MLASTIVAATGFVLAILGDAFDYYCYASRQKILKDQKV